MNPSLCCKVDKKFNTNLAFVCTLSMEEGRRTLPLWLIALMKLRTDEAHIAQPTDRPRGADRRGKGHMMSMSMNTHFVSDYERREGTGKNCTFF